MARVLTLCRLASVQTIQSIGSRIYGRRNSRRTGWITASSRTVRASALPFSLAYGIEIRNWDKPACAGYQWIACFVPILIVFSTYDMEEVTLVKSELFWSVWIGSIIVKGFYNLCRQDD